MRNFLNAIKDSPHAEERTGTAGARLEARTAPNATYFLPRLSVKTGGYWAQPTPTAAPRVSPIERLRTRSAIASRPVGSRLMITRVEPLRFASSGNPAAG